MTETHSIGIIRRFISSFVLFALLTNLLAPSIAVAAECVKTGSVCVEGRQTRNINGVSVTKDCWRYTDSYTCSTVVNGQKSCAPLQAKSGCGQTFSNCLERDFNNVCVKFTRDYQCGTDLKLDFANSLPSGITELPSTHQILTSWDDSQCQAGVNNGIRSACSSSSTTCSSGAATKIINGVSVTQPCWEQTVSYNCLGSSQQTCNAATDSACTLSSSTCLNTVSGQCQVSEDKYKCQIKPGSTTPSDSCKDGDFAQVMTGMETAREYSRYYDPNTQTFFNGKASQCGIKLGGNLGGNCCRTAESADKWTDAALTAALTQGLAAAGASAYTFTIVVTESSAALASVASAMGTAGVGTSVASSTATAGVGGAIGANGSFVITVDPVTMGIAVAIYLVMQWLGCDPEEQKVAIKRKAGICHSVGSFCSKKVTGICVEKKEAQCCFVSKLARIINEGGRIQLNKSWGSATAPQCGGFTQDEIGKLDFSKLDLTEFYDDIKAKSIDSAERIQSTQESAAKKAQSGSNQGGSK